MPNVNRSDRPVSAVLAMIVLALVLLFLSALAWLTWSGYLEPVAATASTRPVPPRPEVKHFIGAYSGLLLTLLLLILGIGSLLTYRIIRFVRPRRTPTRVKTTVIDAWAEAGKRAAEEEE
jgi:TRAP-type C4-dicarboxylate transport system permease small subunit